MVNEVTCPIGWVPDWIWCMQGILKLLSAAVESEAKK